MVEFLLIGDAKLKIVLTEEDLRKYGISSFVKECSGREGRRNFWEVLELAKSEVGFDVGGEKILIQFYPFKAGGCEVFVTKLGILSAPSAKLVTKSDRVTILSKGRSYYLFDSLTDLSNASRAVKLASEGFLPKSDVYFAGGKFFLSVEEYRKGGEPIEFPVILEFGKGLTADFSLYIREHAEMLVGDAGIELFSKL